MNLRACCATSLCSRRRAQSQMQSQGFRQSQQQGFGQAASLFVQGGGFGSSWPAELGSPSSSGAQNDMSYAYFPATRRLAIRVGGESQDL